MNLHFPMRRCGAVLIPLCVALLAYSSLPLLSLLPGLSSLAVAGLGNGFYFFEVCLLMAVRDTPTLWRARGFAALLGVVQVGQGLAAYRFATFLTAEAILGLGSTFCWYNWVDSFLLPSVFMIVICSLPLAAFPWTAGVRSGTSNRYVPPAYPGIGGMRRRRRSTGW